MTRRKRIFAIIMLLVVSCCLMGCGKKTEKRDEEHVKFEILEGTGKDEKGDTYNNAIRVTATGEYPVKVKVTALARRDDLLKEENPYFDYSETLTLEAGESTVVKHGGDPVTTLKVADYDVELLPKECNLTKLFWIIFGINFVIYFVLECVLGDLPAHALVIFCPTFLEMLVIRMVIAWTAIGPIEFILFGMTI